MLGGVLNAGMWVALGSNLDSHETIDYLRWVADHPDRANLAAALGLLAMPFLFGTALVYVLLSRKRSPRLAYTGGILLGCGFFGLSAILGSEIPVARLAQNGGIDLAALSDVSRRPPRNHSGGSPSSLRVGRRSPRGRALGSPRSEWTSAHGT